MNKRILVGAASMAMSVISLAFMGSAQASYNYSALSLPWSTPIDQCIGGAYCGGTGNMIIISTPPNGYIRYVNVTAHDNIGDKHRAILQVYVDGALIDEQDVKKVGGKLYFAVNRVGSTVTLRSYQRGGSGSEETYVNAIEILP